MGMKQSPGFGQDEIGRYQVGFGRLVQKKKASRLCQAAQQLKSGALPWKKAAGIEKQSARDLTALCRQPLPFKPAETPRAFFAGPQRKFLFSFPRRAGVPPTNNHAEQPLGHL